MRIDFDNCIHCRQCEIANKGAFEVRQAWVGSVELHHERCVEGCLACADICPNRALHIDESGELVWRIITASNAVLHGSLPRES